MSQTLISDVFVPALYASYSAVDNPEKTAFMQSGVMQRVAPLDTTFDNGGRIVTLPFWGDIDPTVEANLSDDSTTSATPDKIVASSLTARMSYLNKGLSAADLAGVLAGSDPLQHVKNRFGTYWNRQIQRRLIAALKGVMADNIANDGGDMVVDVSLAAGNSAQPANLLNSDAVINACYTMGDAADAVKAIAMHSVVMARAVKNDDIETIRDSEGKIVLQSYKGLQVIVDDSLPVVAGGTNGFVYTSYLMGMGAIGFGEASQKVPAELERAPSKGNGGGVETLWERKSYCIHPLGYSFTSSSVSGASPTIAELATAANWDRKVSRKLVPLAFLKTNG